MVKERRDNMKGYKVFSPTKETEKESEVEK